MAPPSKGPSGKGFVDALDRVGGLTGNRWPPAPPPSVTSDHPWPLATRLMLIGVSVGLGSASAGMLLMPRPYSALAASGLSLACVQLSQMIIWFFPGTRARTSLGRYRLPLLLSLSLYLIALFGALILFRLGLAAGPTGYLIAAAPAVPLAGAAIVAALFLKNDADELMRRMTVESALWAGGVTLVETTTWGFLETFGLAPHLLLWWVAVAFFVQLSVAGVVVGRRYR